MFKSTHNLPFEKSDWYDPQIECFKIGTCRGLYGIDEESYNIISINNQIPGNGHLSDVFEIFEWLCNQDKKSLKILEVSNIEFMFHLINKRGFKKISGDNVEKTFKKEPVCQKVITT